MSPLDALKHEIEIDGTTVFGIKVLCDSFGFPDDFRAIYSIDIVHGGNNLTWIERHIRHVGLRYVYYKSTPLPRTGPIHTSQLSETLVV